MVKYKRFSILILLMLSVSSVAPASAGFFDDVWEFVGNAEQNRGKLFDAVCGDTSQNKATGEVITTVSMVNNRVKRYNTVQNRERITPEMEHYGVNAVLVDVTDTGERFYIVRDKGIVDRFDGEVDARVEVTSGDVDFVMDRVEDGKIGILERIEISNRMRSKIVYSSVDMSLFSFCLYGGN